MNAPDLEEGLRRLLSNVRVLPRRLSLDTPGVRATAPMLRGVWGAALRSLEPATYSQVFQGGGPRGAATPLYVIRPALPDPADTPALDWILLGAGADEDRSSLVEAWSLAAERGLGRERLPFEVRRMQVYRPCSGLATLPADSASAWPLSRAAWPLAMDVPCRLRFTAPVRILRRGALIAQPTLADLTVAALRRVETLLPQPHRRTLAPVGHHLLAVAKTVPAAPWNGARLDLRRWSGSQKKEIEMRGVAGWLDLPSGPGPTGPLLAAAQWLHLGKATTVGLGRLTVEPLDGSLRGHGPDAGAGLVCAGGCGDAERTQDEYP